MCSNIYQWLWDPWSNSSFSKFWNIFHLNLKFSVHLICLSFYPVQFVLLWWFERLKESVVKLDHLWAERNSQKAKVRCSPLLLASSPLRPEGSFWVVVSCYQMVCGSKELDSRVPSVCSQSQLPLSCSLGKLIFYSKLQFHRLKKGIITVFTS